MAPPPERHAPSGSRPRGGDHVSTPAEGAAPHEAAPAGSGPSRQAEALARAVAGIAHSLRQPLSVISMGSGALLRGSELDPELRERVEAIERNARAMDSMLRELVDFSGIVCDGRIRTQPHTADLSEICQGVMDELNSEQTDLDLRFRLVGDGRGVWDAARIRQMVTAMVRRALAWGDRGGTVQIEISGRDDTAEVSVLFPSIPLPAETIRAFFEPFPPNPPGARRTPAGVGLEMYIAREIANAHGGTVAVRSAPSQGTTITVDLPRRVPAG